MDKANKSKKDCSASSKEEEGQKLPFSMLIIVVMGTLILGIFRLFGYY